MPFLTYLLNVLCNVIVHPTFPCSLSLSLSLSSSRCIWFMKMSCQLKPAVCQPLVLDQVVQSSRYHARSLPVLYQDVDGCKMQGACNDDQHVEDLMISK